MVVVLVQIKVVVVEQQQLDLMHKALLELQKLEVEMVEQEQHQVLMVHQQAEQVEVEEVQITIHKAQVLMEVVQLPIQ
jgi:Asp-tRNA(Asn)/Glu-tRNA(Gln) amidotransferase C subunit